MYIYVYIYIYIHVYTSVSMERYCMHPSQEALMGPRLMYPFMSSVQCNTQGFFVSQWSLRSAQGPLQDPQGPPGNVKSLGSRKTGKLLTCHTASKLCLRVSQEELVCAKPRLASPGQAWPGLALRDPSRGLVWPGLACNPFIRTRLHVAQIAFLHTTHACRKANCVHQLTVLHRRVRTVVATGPSPQMYTHIL